MYHSTCALDKVVREYSVANNGSMKVTLETNSNEGTASDGSMKETTVTNNDGDTGSLRKDPVTNAGSMKETAATNNDGDTGSSREDPVTNDAGDIGSKASSKLSLF